MFVYINNGKLIALHKDAEQFRVFVETLMGINVYVADGLCNYKAAGLDIAAALSDYDSDRKEVVIYINSKLLNGPKELYNAVCLHELGHVFNGHISDAMRDRVLIDKRLTIKLELEADAWAVAHGADAKVLRDYLKDVRDAVIDTVGKEVYEQLFETYETVRMFHTELDKRITALSKQ